jgi:hypothetical protein
MRRVLRGYQLELASEARTPGSCGAAQQWPPRQRASHSLVAAAAAARRAAAPGGPVYAGVGGRGHAGLKGLLRQAVHIGPQHAVPLQLLPQARVHHRRGAQVGQAAVQQRIQAGGLRAKEEVAATRRRRQPGGQGIQRLSCTLVYLQQNAWGQPEGRQAGRRQDSAGN